MKIVGRRILLLTYFQQEGKRMRQIGEAVHVSCEGQRKEFLHLTSDSLLNRKNWHRYWVAVADISLRGSCENK